MWKSQAFRCETCGTISDRLVDTQDPEHIESCEAPALWSLSTDPPCGGVLTPIISPVRGVNLWRAFGDR